MSSAGGSTGPAPEMIIMTARLTVERDGLMLSGGGGRESSADAKQQEAELGCGAHQHGRAPSRQYWANVTPGGD